MDLSAFLRDDFIYDTKSPLIKYIDISSNLLIDSNNDYEKITISLSDEDIEGFNNFIKKYRRNIVTEGLSLVPAQNYAIQNVKIYFYIWTPNNEYDSNSNGWELPSDYFGPTDPRITLTPYRFMSQPYGIQDLNWDPFFVVNNKTELGFNIGANGTIKKEFIITSNTDGDFVIDKENIVFDISYTDIINNTQYNILNKKIPNPYLYKKNNIYGVPYIARWGYEISTTKPLEIEEGEVIEYIFIESRVRKQTGSLGNPENDFNFKYKFSNEYYLELDKSVLQNYPYFTI